MKNKSILLLLCSISPLVEFYAQSEAGVAAGVNISRLYTLNSSEGFKSSFSEGDGKILSIHYQEAISDESFVKLALSFNQFSIFTEVSAPNSYNNSNYELAYIYLNPFYLRKLVSFNRFSLLIALGPYFAYLVDAKQSGRGWKNLARSRLDTSGNTVHYLHKEQWSKKNTPVDEINKFNFGASVGLDFRYSFSNRVSLLLSPSYGFGITYVITEDFPYNSLGSTFLHLGISYSLSHMDLLIE